MKNLLVTGGCGFIGSNFIHAILGRGGPAWGVTCVDKLTYAGNIHNLKGLLGNPRLRIYRADVSDEEAIRRIFLKKEIDYVVHFAAESHVDRSLKESRVFLQTNIVGTSVLAEISVEMGVERFIQVSTDEVYGSLGPNDPPFSEEDRMRPNNLYAASKAGADLVLRSLWKTKGLPLVITRCSNNYGPRQFPEKLVPKIITNAIGDSPVPIYGDGKNVRDWIHVDDHCEAIMAVLERGTIGEVYNFGGGSEITNLALARRILAILGKPETLIQFVEDRPAHDLRYAMDYSKARDQLGWEPRFSLEEGLNRTIRWYVDNQEWTSLVRSGRYRDEEVISKHVRRPAEG